MSKKEQINKLRHNRNAINTKLTRFNKILENELKDDNIIQLEIRLQDLEAEFVKFKDVQLELEYLDDKETEQREQIETTFFEIVSAAKSILQSNTKKLESNSNQSNLNNSKLTPNLTLTKSENYTKLPDIGLPSFNGTYDTWLSFFDLFKSVVHDRQDLSDVQRFLYLKTCCKQDALIVIDSLEVTAENYKTALELLKKRFENKRAIVNHHVNALLFKLPEVTRESHVSLRKLLDTVLQHINALSKLNLPTDQWDNLLIPLILHKLDDRTKREWENKQEENVLPKFKQLTEFLSKKCYTLEAVYSDSQKTNNKGYRSTNTNENVNVKQTKQVQQVYAITSEVTEKLCYYCKDNSHFIYNCPEFIKLSVDEKYKEVQNHKLCTNCLRMGHFKSDCKAGRCRKCSFKHNTLLHADKSQFSISPRNTQEPVARSSGATETSAIKRDSNKIGQGQTSDQVQATVSTAISNYYDTGQGSENLVCSMQNVSKTFQVSQTPFLNQVLLSTAKIFIYDRFGNQHECIALLDSGSQSNLITQELCAKLNLKTDNLCMSIAGINQGITNIKQKTCATIQSRYNLFKKRLTFLVIPVITEKLPINEFEKTGIDYPSNLNLADEEFNIPKTIDVLLGANIFYELLGEGKLKLGNNMPVLHETRLGWIFTGTIQYSNKHQLEKTVCNLSTKISNETLNENLTKFWQVEELPQKQLMSREFQLCEDYFKETTTRNADGRFVVRLPFIENSNKQLGDSKSIAIKRIYGLEKRFQNDIDLKNNYVAFMREYETLNHMSFICNVDSEISREESSYFLPHHAVIRQSATTTKCRVVFDASAKSSTNVSLNELLLVGPTVQDDLFAIVLRLRLRKYVLNADVKMMYRQILVHPNDRKYQKILWREKTSDNLKVYELNTITYGTASAPFLATRCLQQLAEENEYLYPRTCNIIKNSFYMDDLLVSLDSIDEALEVYSELTKILLTAGFPLRKWSSNEKCILDEILKNNSNDDKLVLPHDDKELKTLGISWNSSLDIFTYSVSSPSSDMPVTKRTILSVITQIFDPLGLIGPAIIKSKILMQRLWQLRIDWDAHIPEELKILWQKFSSQLSCLNNIQVNRQVLCDSPTLIELHGFCDASERAYGACIYLCSTDINGKRHCRLLCAKSRVAPLKKLTLPRLELQAAVLLAQLANTVQQHLGINISKTIFYSDSTIVLSWLKIEPCQLKTFVANRVVQILELTNNHDWRHVNSESNAADVISRGLDPEELVNLSTWWLGPSFIVNLNKNDLDNDFNLEFNCEPIEILPELKVTHVNLHSTKISNEISDLILFKKYSTFNKLQRVIGYICRFKNRALKKQPFTTTTLTVEELDESRKLILKLAQREMFSSEIDALINSIPLNKNSKIINLNPFLDKDGILRVGGRLSNSLLDYEQKHPVILSNHHELTYLIVRDAHLKNLHASTQSLHAIVRLNYWIIKGKNVIKQIIRKCIRCFKNKPKPGEFLMGDLPRDRVIPSRPFSKCGVDYAGPIMVKGNTSRRSRIVKTYICIFVCFCTHAVHIELVKDLSTDSFLNSLKRFISRRGKPTDIYSDNGLNFVGASNQFIELYNLLKDNTHHEIVTQFLAADKIKWHFIPPKAPHMGGLWESAVKSTKYHLRRLLENSFVTYEELNTILTQVEACLNSRPLTPLSTDPDDFSPLTPAHFLIGDSLASAPQLDIKDSITNRLTRYQRLQQLTQQFWDRWSKDYLSQFQQRSKWFTNVDQSLKVGSLVLIQDNNLPPFRWPLARVTQLHPGADNIVRVVSVKIPSGSVFKRSLKNICVLPIDTST